jgi:hypothetical protein
MLWAHENKGHRNFLKSIRGAGALFFGVPSRGMDVKALHSMVKGQPNNALLESLRDKSPELLHQSRRFQHTFGHQRSRFAYFYETMHSPTAQKVSSLYAFLVV